MDKGYDGYFRTNYFRICFLRAETLSLIFDHLEDEKLYEMGREVGEKLPLNIEDGLEHRFHSVKDWGIKSS